MSFLAWLLFSLSGVIHFAFWSAAVSVRLAHSEPGERVVPTGAGAQVLRQGVEAGHFGSIGTPNLQPIVLDGVIRSIAAPD